MRDVHSTIYKIYIAVSTITHIKIYIIYNKYYLLFIYYNILYVEQIGKRGISFSGSQYGSCSTTYNTLPVTKVVYN